MKLIERLSLLGNREEQGWKRYVTDTILATLAALLVTGSIYLLRLYPKIPNISLIYLLVVLGLAIVRGRYAAVITCVVTFFSFDFFLVSPLYTFTIGKFEEWLALFVFLVTAIITGQLASALWQRAEQAHRRESEARALYELVRATASEQDVKRRLSIVACAIVQNFSASGIRDCAILLPDAHDTLLLQASAVQPLDQLQLSPDEEAAAARVERHGQLVDLHHGFVPPRSADNSLLPVEGEQVMSYYVRMIPLKVGQKTVGVVRLLLEHHPHRFATEQSPGIEREHLHPRMTFFWSFLDQAASIVERERLRRESLQIELLKRTDELRSALLSSVSHDLRTPLASIKAAASSLLQEDVQWDEEARESFASTIEHEADRLNRLVGNLLDMSRIEGGALKPEKEWYPIDELIHDVVDRMSQSLQGREVYTAIPDDLPPVQLDYLHMDQVLTNLLENAIRYTPVASPIEISAQVSNGQMLISIADRGPGIPVEDRERVFDKFYRVMGAQRKGTIGSGLGLAVCRGLVEAHGGRIWVENRKDGGSVFRFTLPLSEAHIHQ